MTLTLMVITDGRSHCLTRTLRSLELCTDPTAIDRRIVVNDCPGPDYGDWIDATFKFDTHLRGDDRRGFAGAIQAGWAALGDTDWVLHLEDDFVWNRYVDLRAITATLTAQPHLTQMALRRQAWNENEKKAGGIIEQHPEQYHEVADRRHPHVTWLEHRMFFTTNPSVYPISTTATGWPSGLDSEGHFSAQLFADPEKRSAFWGRRVDPPWVEHIGYDRVGTGYW